MTENCIAIDWGTTNRRAWLLRADGEAPQLWKDDRGVLSIAPGGWEAALAGIRAQLGDYPAIAAGMVGSSRGWVEAPYVDLPAGAADLAARLVEVPGQRLRIVPGLCRRQPADVMRGEDVQVLGAIAAGLCPPHALLCQPGTHNKWIVAEGGRITGISTSMTGEIFALLRSHSILADMLKGPVAVGPAFDEGVRRAGGNLLSTLFGIRAGVLLGEIAAADAASLLSGLLIGADVAAQDVSGQTVHVIAGAALAAPYAAAIRAHGGMPVGVDSERAFLAGIQQIRSLADAAR